MAQPTRRCANASERRSDWCQIRGTHPGEEEISFAGLKTPPLRDVKLPLVLAITKLTSPNPKARATRRWLVHFLLLASATASLALEPVLTLHVIFGLFFVAFVTVHLAQRRRISISLLRRLGRRGRLTNKPGRLAMADLVLAALTTAMLASGLWDWLASHPTTIRWHALTGVALALLVAVHTARRRSRLRSSRVR